MADNLELRIEERKKQAARRNIAEKAMTVVQQLGECQTEPTKGRLGSPGPTGNVGIAQYSDRLFDITHDYRDFSTFKSSKLLISYRNKIVFKKIGYNGASLLSP